MDTKETTLIGNLDYPDDKVEGLACLIARGWVFSGSGAAVTAVRARVGKRCFAGKHGLPRPDVAAHFTQAAAATSGFEIPMRLKGLRQRIHIEVTRDGIAWETFRTLELKRSLSAWLAQKKRWGSFWLQAWSGRTDAWEKLSWPECEVLFRQIETEGLLNIRVQAQYTPRQVESESFRRSGKSAERLPKLTVATPSFNQAPFLEATMLSVLQQEGLRVDYLVQDGASKDESRSIIERFAAKYPADRGALVRLTHWASEADQGQADALNRAFVHTDCGPEDIMAYLNSDDLLMPGAARYVAEYFAKHPEVDVVYGHRVLVDEQGQEIGRWITPRHSHRKLALNDLIPQETLFWRKRLWDKIGGFDASLHFALDWDLLQRLQQAGATFARLPRFLGLFRVHSSQKTQAMIGQTGLQEMNQLRRRALGRDVAPNEAEAECWRAAFDSALVYRLLKKGIRV